MLNLRLYILSFLLLAIPSLAAPAAPIVAPARVQAKAGSAALPVPPNPTKRVEWITEFPAHLLAGSEIDLKWKGGSGKGYDLYYIPTWHGSPDEMVQVPIMQTARKSTKWTVPSLDAYPSDTTLILVVRDTQPAKPKIGKRSASVSWFDASRAMGLADRQMYRRSLQQRRL